MPPTKFRTRPTEVEAIQWDGSVAHATEVIDWVLTNGGTARWQEKRYTDTSYNPFTDTYTETKRRSPAPAHISVDITGAVVEKALARDFIVRLPAGSFTVVDPISFLAEFLAVADA